MMPSRWVKSRDNKIDAYGHLPSLGLSLEPNVLNVFVSIARLCCVLHFGSFSFSFLLRLQAAELLDACIT
jgi:hypothetical protein